jgi:uncharacterized protein (UPF0264 family)
MNGIRSTRSIRLTERSGAETPGLLVSVRDAQEAVAALAGGADVIDVKEPSAGPLGAASIEAISAVIAAVAQDAPITVATGDLGDIFPWEEAPPGIAIAKLGLAGSVNEPWRTQTQQWAERLPATTAGALVAYADWQAAKAPAPEEVLSHAIEIGCAGFVLDTWSKAGRCSLDLLDAERLRLLIGEAIAKPIVVVLAGSITQERLAEAASCGPTLVGVRGAACVGGRSGVVDAERVRALAGRLDACRRGG